jgi:hypothetical protein
VLAVSIYEDDVYSHHLKDYTTCYMGCILSRLPA